MSKGIGRAAADALVDEGWSVIGVARSAPNHFPGIFIETDLADRNQSCSSTTRPWEPRSMISPAFRELSGEQSKGGDKWLKDGNEVG